MIQYGNPQGQVHSQNQGHSQGQGNPQGQYQNPMFAPNNNQMSQEQTHYQHNQQAQHPPNSDINPPAAMGIPSQSMSHSQSVSPNRSGFGGRPEDRQIRPANGNPFGTATADNTDKQGHRQAASPQQELAANPGIGGGGAAEDKEGPPPLKASVRKGSERVIELFGER